LANRVQTEDGKDDSSMNGSLNKFESTESPITLLKASIDKRFLPDLHMKIPAKKKGPKICRHKR